MDRPVATPSAVRGARGPLIQVTALAVIIGFGTAHGYLTYRWAPAQTSTDMDLLPLTIEDWDGTAVDPVEAGVPLDEGLDILIRRYVHRTTGSSVIIYLTAGRPGPLGTSHNPDSCYPSSGFTFATPMTTQKVSGGPAERAQEFRVATFSKADRANPIHARVFWAWSADGEWSVPDSPKVAFAKYRRLYKMYVIRPLVKPTEVLEGDPAVDMIQVLVPALRSAYFER